MHLAEYFANPCGYTSQKQEHSHVSVQVNRAAHFGPVQWVTGREGLRKKMDGSSHTHAGFHTTLTSLPTVLCPIPSLSVSGMCAKNTERFTRTQKTWSQQKALRNTQRAHKQQRTLGRMVHCGSGCGHRSKTQSRKYDSLWEETGGVCVGVCVEEVLLVH